MVRQLIEDYEDVEEVNKQLDKMWAAGGRAGSDGAAVFATACCSLLAASCCREFPAGQPIMWPRARSLTSTSALLPSALCRGFSIGQRLIDEFLAKSKTQRCSDFREVAEKVGGCAWHGVWLGGGASGRQGGQGGV